MIVDLLTRRWGGPKGGPDGMAIAAARLAWVLAESGHKVRAYSAHGDIPWSHPLVEWRPRSVLVAPDAWDADLVITTQQGCWRRTVSAAKQAGAEHKLAYWHHFNSPPPGYGCHLLLPTPCDDLDGWASVTSLPPSSWACEGQRAPLGDRILVPGVSLAKGGRIALEVARACADLRFYVLPGRANDGELAPWRHLPNVEIAPGHIEQEKFLGLARLVLSPTRIEVHPLTLVEAAVRGIPIVASDIPGCRAAAPTARLLAHDRPPAEWAEACRKALASPAEPLVLRPYAEVAGEALAALTRSVVAHRPSAPASPPSPASKRTVVRDLDEPAWIGKPHDGLPRVLIIADVPNWAWGRKARSLQRCLADRFDVEICYSTDPESVRAIRKARHDLYHTFECVQVGGIPRGWPLVTGITAHVAQTWEDRHGAGTVRGWADRCLAFHANSKMLQAEMERLLTRQIWYCPNGVDVEFWQRLRPRKADHLVVGHAARPSPRKGATLIAEACKQLGIELRALNRTCHDALTFPQMRDWYQDIHVLTVSSDMDGTPNPALEAAACECAVVSNPIGNMPELLANGRAGILTPRTVAGLVDALGALRDRPLEEVEEIGRAARAEILAGWTWQIQSENYAAMWRHCLGRTA